MNTKTGTISVISHRRSDMFAPCNNIRTSAIGREPPGRKMGGKRTSAFRGQLHLVSYKIDFIEVDDKGTR